MEAVSEVAVEYEADYDLTVTASSDTGRTITYKWYYYDEFEREEVLIADVVRPRYTVRADKDMRSQYICKVSDGVVTKSVVIHISIDSGLSVDYKPSIEAEYGSYVPLHINAASSAGRNITYQWYECGKENTVISGAKEATYVVKADVSGGSKYMCRIRDGVVTKDIVMSVIPTMDTVVRAYRENVAVVIGDECELRVVASNDKNIATYSWYQKIFSEDGSVSDNVPLFKETANTYTFEMGEDTAGTYSCVCLDIAGAEKTVTFNVGIDSGFYLKNAGKKVPVHMDDEEVTIENEANSDYGNELEYTWYSYDKGLNEYVLLENETDVNYLVSTDASDGDLFKCVVTDGYSQGEVIYVISRNKGINITNNEFNEIELEQGENTLLSVTAESDEALALSYQWYRADSLYSDRANYRVLTGSNKSSIQITGTYDTDLSYKCVVSDGFGSKSVYFNIPKDNSLNIEYIGDVNIPYGESVVLAPRVTSSVDGNITYRWESDTLEALGTASSYELMPALELPSFIKCYISDGVSESCIVYNINVDTGFRVSDDKSLTSDDEGNVNMKVTAVSNFSDHITYSWYREVCNGVMGEYVRKYLEAPDSNSYAAHVDSETAAAYVCIVSDGYNTKAVKFSINSSKKLIPVDDHDVYNRAGDTQTLESEVVSEDDKELTYCWYMVSDGSSETNMNYSLDKYTDSIDVECTKEGNTVYSCIVSDGDTFVIEIFNVFTASEDLQLSQSITVEDGNEIRKVYKDDDFNLYAESDGDGELTYTSSDTDIVVVDDFGNVTIQGAGSATITIDASETEMYKPASKEVNIIVMPMTIKASNAVLSGNTTYTGSSVKPKLIITDNSYFEDELVYGTDYTASYSNNVKVGTASVKVVCKGNYTGTFTKTFTIARKKLQSSNIKLSTTSYTCNGKLRNPFVSVKDGSRTMKLGTDYTIAYSNNKNVGTAYVKVTGKGNYTGTVAKAFVINPVKTGGKSSSVTASSVKLTWSKVSNATGYEIYRLSGKTWKKVAVVKGSGTTKYTVTKLAAGTSYKFRVRVYSKVGSKTYVSAYSKDISDVTLPGTVSLKTVASTGKKIVRPHGRSLVA